MAVLPTPGSPISTGLFLVRRCSTCTVRRISSSRPMTGSSLPLAARSVRSMVYLSSAPRFSSAFGIRHLLAAAHLLDGLLDRALDGAGILQDARERALVLERGQHEELARDELVAALLRELVGEIEHAVEIVGDVDLARRRLPPCGSLSSAASRSERSLLTLTPALTSSGRTVPPSCCSSASITCAGSMIWWSRPSASDWASASAAWNLLVSLSIRMGENLSRE